MKRLLRIGIVSLSAAVVLFAAYHYLRAQGQATPPATPHPLVDPISVSPPAPPQVLKETIFSQGYPQTSGAETGGTIYAIDSPNTFRCWRPCTLEVDQKVNEGNFGTPSATDNWLWLAFVVDGPAPTVGTEAPFYAVDELPTDGSWVMGVLDTTVSLKPGTHTVQSFVYLNHDGTLWDYHINYRIYEQEW